MGVCVSEFWAACRQSCASWTHREALAVLLLAAALLAVAAGGVTVLGECRHPLLAVGPRSQDLCQAGGVARQREKVGVITPSPPPPGHKANTARTSSLYASLLWHVAHWHWGPHTPPLAKQTQYSFRHLLCLQLHPFPLARLPPLGCSENGPSDRRPADPPSGDGWGGGTAAPRGVGAALSAAGGGGKGGCTPVCPLAAAPPAPAAPDALRWPDTTGAGRLGPAGGAWLCCPPRWPPGASRATRARGPSRAGESLSCCHPLEPNMNLPVGRAFRRPRPYPPSSGLVGLRNAMAGTKALQRPANPHQGQRLPTTHNDPVTRQAA
jgi:hypothetical protein